MFGLVKKMFFVLLSNTVNGSNHTKCVLLSSHTKWISLSKRITQPTLNNLHLHECSQKFHYYPFSVKSDRCVGS